MPGAQRRSSVMKSTGWGPTVQTRIHELLGWRVLLLGWDRGPMATHRDQGFWRGGRHWTVWEPGGAGSQPTQFPSPGPQATSSPSADCKLATGRPPIGCKHCLARVSICWLCFWCLVSGLQVKFCSLSGSCSGELGIPKRVKDLLPQFMSGSLLKPQTDPGGVYTSCSCPTFNNLNLETPVLGFKLFL